MMGPGPSCPDCVVGLVPVPLSNADLVSVSWTYSTTTSRLGCRRMASLKREHLCAVIPRPPLRLTVGSGYRDAYGT
jgi:hypothetical protein